MKWEINASVVGYGNGNLFNFLENKRGAILKAIGSYSLPI